MTDIYTRLDAYGVKYSGEQVSASYHDGVDYTTPYSLAAVQAAGGKVTRVRLLTERWGHGRMADVSYIHATLADGRTVPVNVGMDPGPLYGSRGVKARMIEWAKSEGVFAKGLGLLDEGNWSVLY